MAEYLKELLARVTDQPYLQAGIVVFGGFLLAVLINNLLTRVVLPILGRVTKTSIDDDIVMLLRGPILKTVMLIALGIATAILGLEPGVTKITTRILWTIGILVWTAFTFRLVNRLLLLAKGREDKFLAIESRTFPLFDNAGKVVIFAVAAYLVIRAWDADPAAWLASAGIVGLALSFAAQDSLANLFAGVFIIADRPYSVGEFVQLETGERGEISHIGLRSTRLLTRDDIEVTIPNSVMGKAKIINESAGPHPKHRVRIKVGVAYGTDADLVRKVLLEAAAAEPLVCQDPEARVRFRAFGESSLDFELLAWIPEPVLRGRVIDSLNTKVYKAFGKNGIEIPFPQRDVHIKQMPRGLGGAG